MCRVLPPPPPPETGGELQVPRLDNGFMPLEGRGQGWLKKTPGDTPSGPLDKRK